MSTKELIKAVAYFRTSSLANVGPDKDSEKRQREAVTKFANSAGYAVVAEYSDEGVKGLDAIDQRPGFAALLERILSNGVRTIIVENASRFSRDLITQETGYQFLKAQGVTLIATDSPESFLSDTPTATLIRQVLGAVSQFDKASLVAKLKGARDRKRVSNGGKCEGRKSYQERDADMVALAKKLHRYPVNGRRRSLREVAVALQEQGFVSAKGTPFTATAISRMID
jgi:DNA invertase Pin-like site-specific DNA recombinase